MDNNYIGDNTETWTKEVKKQEEEAEKELIEWKKLKRMEKIARLKENWKAKSNGKRETEKKREKFGEMKEISEEEARCSAGRYFFLGFL